LGILGCVGNNFFVICTEPQQNTAEVALGRFSNLSNITNTATMMKRE
jgi:hypothetical protein